MRFQTRSRLDRRTLASVCLPGRLQHSFCRWRIKRRRRGSQFHCIAHSSTHALLSLTRKSENVPSLCSHSRSRPVNTCLWDFRIATRTSRFDALSWPPRRPADQIPRILVHVVAEKMVDPVGHRRHQIVMFEQQCSLCRLGVVRAPHINPRPASSNAESDGVRHRR